MNSERRLWTFDEDPGLQTHFEGSDPAFKWDITGGILTVKVSLDEHTQRIVLPLQDKYDLSQRFRMRTRFQMNIGWRGRLQQGFFNSSAKNFTGDLTGDHIAFRYVANPSHYPNLHVGDTWGLGEQTLTLDNWYVMDADCDGQRNCWSATLYKEDGKTKLQTVSGTTGRFDGEPAAVDVIGFGNFDLETPPEDEHHNGSDFEVKFDWFSFSVNEPLPPDPPPATFARNPKDDSQTHEVDELRVWLAENSFIYQPPVGKGVWLFDEGPEEAQYWSIVDQSGHCNHGCRKPKAKGYPAHTTDTPFSYPGNYALDFSSDTSAYVEVRDDPSLCVTDSLTVETWVCLKSLGQKQYLIWKRRRESAPNGYSLEWSGQEDQSVFTFTVGTPNGYQSVHSRSFRCEPGTWVHVAGVHDSQSGKNLLYIDGSLNNSEVSEKGIITNDQPLCFGGDPSGCHFADAILDEVRISGKDLSASELGHSESFGPGKILHGDNFETYSTTDEVFSPELASKTGDTLNRWKTTGPRGTSVQLTSKVSRSGNNSVLLSYVDMPPEKAADALYFWYDGRPELFFSRGKIGFEGWVSFENLDSVKLFFLNFKDGIALRQGSQDRINTGAALLYDSREKRWNVEIGHGGGYAPFSEPVTYKEGLGDVWHFFKFVVDFDNRRPVSFQFDDKTWDLTEYSNWVLTGFEGGLPPFMTLNIRVFTYDTYDRPYSTFLAVDDIAVTNEDIR